MLTPRYAFPPSDDPWVQALRDAWQAWEGGLVYNTDHYLGVQEFVYTFLFEDWVYNEETGEDEWVSEWVESRYRLVIRMGCGTYSPGSGGGQVYVDVEVSPGSWENIGIWISILAGFEPRTCCRWHFAYIYDGSYIETPTELLVTHNRCCLNEEMTECVVCENPCTHSSSSEE